MKNRDNKQQFNLNEKCSNYVSEHRENYLFINKQILLVHAYCV